VFIALGAALLAAFNFMFLVFGLVLVGTAVQLFRHRNEDPSVDDNALVAIARRALPLSKGYEQGRILTRVDGHRALTPLFLVLIAIGSTDVLFAFDSIPAVFGVTKHAYIVFAANAFALLGLRALFFLVSGLLDRLVYLSTGLAVILAFIGVKLVLEFAHQQDPSIPEISTGLSLAVIVAVITATVAASLFKVRRDPSIRAHAGALHEHRQDPSSQPHLSDPAP
jgi:tellurite resistance protein TerC